ncbi:efflux RND transporter permease subunit [Aromatoleum petrolei]|uniref:efflux RND transporter permease subunit n=1 Tax=Aromatoleum petrolei TaxID=76116 RepID=UPI001BB7AFF5|nr:efflux RND transporter permease subunit [Aromatoleum petrolei]QTQ34911.1 Putative membrane transport protein, MMPL domain-containing [Aromatoleum petrolei]
MHKNSDHDSVIRQSTDVESVVHGEFRSEEFSQGFIGRIAYATFRWRLPLLVVGILLTLVLGFSATSLRVSSGFAKMIPANHEYMKTFEDYKADFGGADKVLVAIKVREGDIYRKEVIDVVRGVTEELFYLKGVDRSSLTSLVTPNVRYNEVVEEGFKSGNLVPADFSGTTEEFAKVRQNILKSDWIGRIVAADMTATMVVATLQSADPDTGKELDLREVGAKLEEIRGKYENDAVTVHIIGFAKATADIAEGASSVLLFFVVAFFITGVLLFWYSGSLMLTAWALVAALIPVIWLLGILPLLGMGLDPMSILVPFLIFAIGVSHAVQMTNAWKLETLRGHDGVTASRNCFLKLFIPGATALLANALGFMVIAVVDIQIVRELAYTSTIGVTVMILTNKLLLPILLSYMRFSAKTASRLSGHETAGYAMWERLGVLATPRGAVLPIVVALALTGVGVWKLGDLKIGDLGTGVPELRADSRYNRDVDMITGNFAIGVDLLQVIAEADGGDSPCVQREVQEKVEKFDFAMRQTEGVAAVRSLSSFIGAVTQDFAEGWYRWRMLPETVPQIAQGIGMATRLGNEYRNSKCTAMPISIYTTDHQATTINHIVERIKAFKAENDTDTLRFRLASGNVGVMAATNEVVERSDKWVNFTLFSAVALLCLVTFRSLRITLCIIVPLALVTLLCNATMAALGIGVKVNTLPVIAIAVGVGVDYGIYLFERIKHEMQERGASLRDAFVQSLKDRGTASVFTAVTMTVSVLTWALSTLKFQADMGILLAFMFMVNLFGAILLLPAIAAFVMGGEKRSATATRPTEREADPTPDIRAPRTAGITPHVRATEA